MGRRRLGEPGVPALPSRQLGRSWDMGPQCAQRCVVLGVKPRQVTRGFRGSSQQNSHCPRELQRPWGTSVAVLGLSQFWALVSCVGLDPSGLTS